jgi:hypothetical protein
MHTTKRFALGIGGTPTVTDTAEKATLRAVVSGGVQYSTQVLNGETYPLLEWISGAGALVNYYSNKSAIIIGLFPRLFYPPWKLHRLAGRLRLTFHHNALTESAHPADIPPVFSAGTGTAFNPVIAQRFSQALGNQALK